MSHLAAKTHHQKQQQLKTTLDGLCCVYILIFVVAARVCEGFFLFNVRVFPPFWVQKYYFSFVLKYSRDTKFSTMMKCVLIF